MQRQTENRSAFDRANWYRIKAKGQMGTSWSDAVAGMTIEYERDDSDHSLVITILTGELVDQAALIGVLSTVYMLGMPLLEVSLLSAAEVKALGH